MALFAHKSGLPCRASVVSIESAGPDIRLIRLKPEAPFAYEAGQFVDISFDGLEPRPYSIASAPGGDSFEIHIKRGKGPASAYALEKLAPGEKVSFSGPKGRSWLDPDSREPVIAIAGGLGIAPIRAIAEEAMKTQTPVPFTLYWGTFKAADRYLEDYFVNMAAQHAAFNYHPVTGSHIGDAALQEIAGLPACRLFVSGPPAMIDDLVPRLLACGAPLENIRFDHHPEATGTAG